MTSAPLKTRVCPRPAGLHGAGGLGLKKKFVLYWPRWPQAFKHFPWCSIKCFQTSQAVEGRSSWLQVETGPLDMLIKPCRPRPLHGMGGNLRMSSLRFTDERKILAMCEVLLYVVELLRVKKETRDFSVTAVKGGV